jgi:hypothetical protein
MRLLQLTVGKLPGIGRKRYIQEGAMDVQEGLHHPSIAGSNFSGFGDTVKSTFPRGYLRSLGANWGSYEHCPYHCAKIFLRENAPWFFPVCPKIAKVRFEYLAAFDLDFYLENKRLETYFFKIIFDLNFKRNTQRATCALISFNFLYLTPDVESHM